ncbi:MAG: hypothetical protein Q9168_006930, partial [Polycauliona sp. 1 TL-2023]
MVMLLTVWLSPRVVSRARLIEMMKMLFFSLITYVFTVTLVRISILLLYRRIFDIQSFRRVATGFVVICVAWAISVLAADIFQCHRIPDAFKVKAIADPAHRCVDLRSMLYGALASGFALDVIILVLPFQQIWRLQLERRQKYELMAILSLGGL